MSNENGYNGWKNYETWCVNLWLSNDYGSCQHWEATAEECYAESEDKDEAVDQLATMLEESFDESNPVGGDCSVFSDLLAAALSEVDWHEIAAGYISELPEKPVQFDELSELAQAKVIAKYVDPDVDDLKTPELTAEYLTLHGYEFTPDGNDV